MDCFIINGIFFNKFFDGIVTGLDSLGDIVDFNATKFSDGSSLRSSCRVTFEIDNKTFVTPDAERVPVSNKQYDSLFRNLPTYDAQQVVIFTIISLVGFGLLMNPAGAAATATILAFGYLGNN